MEHLKKRQNRLIARAKRLMDESDALDKESLVFYIMAIGFLVSSFWLHTLFWVGMLAFVACIIWDRRVGSRRRKIDLIMAELKGMQIVMDDVLTRIGDPSESKK